MQNCSLSQSDKVPVAITEWVWPSEKAQIHLAISRDYCSQGGFFFLAGYENRHVDPDPVASCAPWAAGKHCTETTANFSFSRDWKHQRR